MRTRGARIWVTFVATAIVLGACGGTDTASDGTEAPSNATVASEEDSAPPETEAAAVTEAPAAEEPAEETAQPTGDPLITLTIGGETWEFDNSFCAYYNAPAGEEGSEWNVSDIADGLQVYVNSDSFGQDVSIADIENGGNPTVSWEAFGDAVSIEVSGNDITASGTFTDNVNGGTAEGSLTATCPDWVDAT